MSYTHFAGMPEEKEVLPGIRFTPILEEDEPFADDPLDRIEQMLADVRYEIRLQDGACYSAYTRAANAWRRVAARKAGIC